MTTVLFGTSGHRGIMGDSFTLSHVRAIAFGVSVWLKQMGLPLSVAIGYDTRSGNDSACMPGSFTEALVDTLAVQGIRVFFAASPTPTPVISWIVRNEHLGGGLLLTASHNPAVYNGLKFNPPNGAPAPAEITTFIEKVANSALDFIPSSPDSPGEVCRRTDFSEKFAHGLYACLSQWLALDTRQWHIAVDAAHGAVAETWEAIFRVFAVSHYSIFCAEPLPDFGGVEPNPTHPNAIRRLQTSMVGLPATLGIANDPDGDRHIVLDEKGVPLTPEETAALIVEMLVGLGYKPYAIASTLASSSLVRSVAVSHGIGYVETAVGFKYFAPVFAEAEALGQFALGVESSGGLSVSCHTYEKCGFFPLVLAAYVTVSGSPLSVLREGLAKYGQFCFEETSFVFGSDKRADILRFMQDADADQFSAVFGGLPILIKTDGLKLSFSDGSWVLARLSGTEPIGRLYAESNSIEKTRQLLAQLRMFFV